MFDELCEIIKNVLENGTLDKKITMYADYNNKFMFLKPRVKVHVETSDGKEFKIDVTDYFKDIVK